MNRFFIKHKLTPQDITHLSDSDSEFVINKLHLKEENFIEVETYEAIFLAVISDISNNSVEIEVLEKISEKEIKDCVDLTIIQSLAGKDKFRFLIEKSVEIGIDMIIPVESQYSLVNRNKAIKEYGLWKKIVSDAVEQSRNIKPTIIEKPIKLQDLTVDKNQNLLCLTTENVGDILSLKQYLSNSDIKKPFVIAIGPEKGWSSKDIGIFKEKGFKFAKLSGNILRTETSGLVVGSIVKYLKGDL